MDPVIVTGVYGAGKTEFCVHYALYLTRTLNAPVKLADMDIMNPYFRSRDKALFLASQGVSVIGNATGNTGNQDLPAISGEVVRAALAGDALVVDLGGHITGLNALAHFKGHLRGYEMWVVVNAYREESSNAAKTTDFIQKAEETSGLRVTGIVCNTHMLRETDARHVLRGLDLAREASDISGLPIKYVFMPERIHDELIGMGVILPPILTFNKLIMREEWQ